MILDIHTHNAQTHAQTIETAGIHPWHAHIGDLSEVTRRAPEVDAIGEIGLDYACDVPRETQMEVFRAQLAIAERFKRPVVLHCVRAFEDIIKEIERLHLKGVIFSRIYRIQRASATRCKTRILSIIWRANIPFSKDNRSDAFYPTFKPLC